MDLDRMMKSSAPAGTYIFRPSDSNGSGNLTLCVLEEKENGDRTYKKYRVRVESRGGLSPIPKELQFRFLGVFLPACSASATLVKGSP